MITRLAALDPTTIVARVRRATDVSGGRACHPLIQEELDSNPSVGERVASLRNYIGLAALDLVTSPAALEIDQPLVEAFVRTHHHPEAPPTFAPFKVPGMPPAGPRFAELAALHGNLGWDIEIVRSLLWRGVQAGGDHELDDEQPPWLMYWGRSSGAAQALMLLVTYEALGGLEVGARHGEDAGELIDGAPRSSFELAFVAGLRPCVQCGRHEQLPWSSWRVDDDLWRTDATCTCGHRRAYLFRSTEDLTVIEPGLNELGGPEPSSLMTAPELLAEIGRLTPLVVAPGLAADREAAWERLERLHTAVNELAKFLVGPDIPTLGADDRARFDARWIEEERLRLAALES